ncbi:hypothetical protein diail_7469 [Diaporthe ilicicola]|nr:hypothetical protein diail_7469 [Diaporthe ilicicola]
MERRSVLGDVWVDSNRDTAVVSTIRPKLYLMFITFDGFRKVLRSRKMRIALDSSWASTSFASQKNRARELYYSLVDGPKECDFIILDLQLDVDDDAAASTGLFDDSAPSSSVLVPIEDKRQMSGLFAAQAKFRTVDRLNKWANFTQFRKLNNLLEYTKRWEKFGAREMRAVHQGMEFLWM